MVWYGTVRYGMVWYGMIWYGMLWYGMVWYGMVWYGMVWYGMVWYGMVWYGMVWYGVVWYGMVSMVHGFFRAFSQWLGVTRASEPPVPFWWLKHFIYGFYDQCTVSMFASLRYESAMWNG